MTAKYYRLNGKRITLREYRRMVPDPFTLIIIVLTKPFFNLAPKMPVTYPETLAEIRLEELPESVERSLLRQVKKFEADGYRISLVYEIPLLDEKNLTVSVVLISSDGFSLAHVVYIGVGPQSEIAMTVGHFHDDGDYSIVTTKKQELDLISGRNVLRRKGASVEDIMDDYDQIYDEWLDKGDTPVPLNDNNLRVMVLDTERRNADSLIERGVWVPMTAKELARYGIDPDDPDGE